MSSAGEVRICIYQNTDLARRPVENGSVLGPLGTVAEYALQIIQKMQNENIKSLVPRQDVTDSFNEHAQVSQSSP